VIQRKFYSGKHRAHVVKWECAVQINTGRLCWFSDPFKGRRHDLTILRRSGILDQLQAGEKILGDKAYVGEASLITPFKNKPEGLTQEEMNHNQAVNHERAIIERFFGRLKEFRCLKIDWRHSLEKLNWCFVVCLNITNMKLEENPL